MTASKLPPARYDYGGDEFLFVELDQEMSLAVNFKGMAITRQLAQERIPGVLEVCPSNASYMVRIDPDVAHPDALIGELRRVEQQVGTLPDDFVLQTRVVDVPVLFNDPWTHETLMRFRDRHQDPSGTDLAYGARINGFDSIEEFITALSGAPYMVTMLGFVPGLPFCFQMVPRERQVEVPKYVRPRTDTPERAFGFGGAFSVVYPVRGAGGYQLFGIAPAPVFDSTQQLPDFAESIVFPEPGDILRYRRIDCDEFDRLRGVVEAGQFRYHTRSVEFSPTRFLAEPEAVNRELLEVLYA